MKKIFAIAIVLIQSGCAFMLSYIKDKQPVKEETDLAKHANQYMWDQLHLGNYDSIPVVLEKLNAAYQENPNDVKITAHLGFVYLWAFSERVRKPADDRILENILLSNRFFKETLVLNPKDPRIHGFQSAVQLCEGALTNNLEMLAQAYFSSRRAIRKWPQFNRFALGYVESQLDTGSRMYREGLKFQWKIMDECSESKLTREMILESPDLILPKLYTEIRSSNDPEISRACGNSWIAPHNWEGFFLNLGDMLVKAGELDAAEKMYKACRIAPSYEDWAYKEIVEERLKNISVNVHAFNRKQNLLQLDEKTQLMINSEFSCMGCHQMSSKEFANAGYQEPRVETYFLAETEKSAD